MSITDRQNRLLVAEDWRRVYQSFKNADFKSYDFQNLRRVMINYIRENYPEDFNDYIESSEYLALIDLIAFLGQSIAYRVDLNSRDNFLELAERRESVLRLARLLSYNSKRNIAGNGLLKITSLQSTQNVLDSNGRNLSGQVILWNDPSNNNWYDQFIKVLNAALPATRQFGSPEDKKIVYGIPTEQYRFQSSNLDVPLYSFDKNIDGRTMNFEIVSCSIKDADEIYEEPPLLGNRLAFLYRNDSKGSASNNTGFFVHFKQGQLNQGAFTFDQPTPNETLDIDADNINNDDIWLYKLNDSGAEIEYWKKLSSTEGNNVIYNSLEKTIRNFYAVITRVNDRVTLQFSDGLFGNLPLGSFRVYYRTSEGVSYTMNPRDVRNITVEIPYISNFNQPEIIILTLSLVSSVSNSTETESSDDIKQKAPATYYTQNRMITAEDYNLSPFSVNQHVMKVKSVNRSSSGISRYFDLVDPTGKYSKTNLFADDGVIYREEFLDSFQFKFNTKTDIESIIYNQLYDKINQPFLRDFYYAKFNRVLTTDLNVSWKFITGDTNLSTGYFRNNLFPNIAVRIGQYTTTLLKSLVVGSLLKFKSPNGFYFNTLENNTLTSVNNFGTTEFLFVKILKVAGDGTNGGSGLLIDGTGTISLNDIVPENSQLVSIIPPLKSTFNNNVISEIIEQVNAYKTFGLRYNTQNYSWEIIYDVNLNLNNNFTLGLAGDKSNQKLDSSWLISFTTDSEYYTVNFRLLRYIFESDKQIRFYFDSSDKIYDARTNTIEKDQIKILSVNVNFGSQNSLVPFTLDQNWEIIEEYKGLDGYVDSKKIQISFSDFDEDAVVDNPDIFDNIVANSSNNLQTQYIAQELYSIDDQQEDYRYIDNIAQKVIVKKSQSELTDLSLFKDGQYFYFVDSDVVKKLNLKIGELFISSDYKMYFGRDKLKFQYIHNADYESRIDPGITNIIDVFVLTKQYDKQFREYLDGTRSLMPLPLSTDFLYNMLNPELSKIKTISDEIIYHPARYKVLFGSKATTDLQAIFKVVKNNEIVVSDNDVKSKVISAINEFFAINNWNFGDNFYFTELSTYVMNKLATNIVNFIIVPKKSGLSFGSLLEINAEKDQIFVNAATIDDVEIINAVTASRIKTSGDITNINKNIIQQTILSAGNT